MTPSPKPWVQAACICEKVLVEQDRVASLIRVVDTYTLSVPESIPDGWKPKTDLTAFVALKSGDAEGQFEVGLRLVDPNGKASPIRKWPIELRGGEHGANLKVEFNLLEPVMGLYWFDVLWTDGELLTRIPFRLKPEQPISQKPTDEQADTTSERK